MKTIIGITVLILALPAFAQMQPPPPPEGPPLLDQADHNASHPGVSPVRRLDQGPPAPPG